MGPHARSGGCRPAERRIWERLRARSESPRGAAECGPLQMRLYNGPASSRRRRADLVRVKGPSPVNAQRRTGSARGARARAREGLSPQVPGEPVGTRDADPAHCGRRSLRRPSAPRACLAREEAAPASRARLLTGELRAAHPSRSQDRRRRRLPYRTGGGAVSFGSSEAP